MLLERRIHEINTLKEKSGPNAGRINPCIHKKPESIINISNIRKIVFHFFHLKRNPDDKYLPLLLMKMCHKL